MPDVIHVYNARRAYDARTDEERAGIDNGVPVVAGMTVAGLIKDPPKRKALCVSFNRLIELRHQTIRPGSYILTAQDERVKSRVVCKRERKLLDASVRLPWRAPWARGVRGPGNGARSRPQ